MTTFQELTATQWRNRLNEHNPGMYSKEFLKGNTAKELDPERQVLWSSFKAR
jgi:hypothetical protein